MNEEQKQRIEKLITFLQAVLACGEDDPKIQENIPHDGLGHTIRFTEINFFNPLNAYELLPEPKVEYRKFTEEEAIALFRCSPYKVIRQVPENRDYYVSGISLRKGLFNFEGAELKDPENELFTDAESLLKYFTLDGSPCGVEITEEPAGLDYDVAGTIKPELQKPVQIEVWANVYKSTPYDPYSRIVSNGYRICTHPSKDRCDESQERNRICLVKLTGEIKEGE